MPLYTLNRSSAFISLVDLLRDYAVTAEVKIPRLAEPSPVHRRASAVTLISAFLRHIGQMTERLLLYATWPLKLCLP